MAGSSADTTAWVAQQMAQHSDVTGVEILGPHSLRIARKDYPPFHAGVIAEVAVLRAHVEAALAEDRDIEIIMNVPKESKWTGDAIGAATQAGVAWGGMSELFRVAAREDVRGHERDEYRFAGRILRQFGKVAHVEREADRLWVLYRKDGLPPLRVVALNPYELTADHLRTARDRYGAFDVVFLNNPNGKATESGKAVAEDLGVPILMAGELRGWVNAR